MTFKSKEKVFLLSLLFSVEAFAYTVVELTPGDTSRTLTVEGTGCTPFLDDDSNYSVTKLSRQTFAVETKKVNERPAMLLFDCDGQQHVYSLNFKNSAFHQRPTGRQKPSFDDRPQSYFGTSFLHQHRGPTSLGVEWVDGTLPLFTYLIRQDYSDLSRREWRSDSIDVQSQFEPFTVGAGATRSHSANRDQTQVRANIGLWGMTVYASAMHQSQGQKEQRVFISTPWPLSTSYTHTRRTDGSILQSIARPFLFSLKLFRNELQTSFDWQSSRDIGAQSHSFDAKNTSELGLHSLHKIRLSEGGFCRNGNPCLVNLIEFAHIYENESNRTVLAYAPVPHFVSFTLQSFFWDEQAITATLRRILAGPSFLQNSSWVVRNNAAPHTEKRSDLQLMYRYEPFQFSAGIPLVTTDKPETPLLGAQYNRETRSLSATLALSGKPWPKDRTFSLTGSVRYFFEPNLRTLKFELASHQLQGKVVSNLGKVPVSGAKISLNKKFGKILEAQTDENGNFLLKDIPSTGPFEVVVEKKGAHENLISTRKMLQKEREKLSFEQVFELEEYTRVEVRFFLDGGDDLEFSKNDELLPLVNHLPSLDEGIVSAASGATGTNGASGTTFSGNVIYLTRGKPVTLTITEELLPFDYRLIKFKGNPILTSEDGSKTFDVLLKRREIQK